MSGANRINILPYVVVLPLVFIVLLFLGFFMRANQGEIMDISLGDLRRSFI